MPLAPGHRKTDDREHFHAWVSSMGEWLRIGKSRADMKLVCVVICDVKVN